MDAVGIDCMSIGFLSLVSVPKVVNGTVNCYPENKKERKEKMTEERMWLYYFLA